MALGRREDWDEWLDALYVFCAVLARSKTRADLIRLNRLGFVHLNTLPLQPDEEALSVLRRRDLNRHQSGLRKEDGSRRRRPSSLRLHLSNVADLERGRAFMTVREQRLLSSRLRRRVWRGRSRQVEGR